MIPVLCKEVLLLVNGLQAFLFKTLLVNTSTKAIVTFKKSSMDTRPPLGT